MTLKRFTVQFYKEDKTNPSNEECIYETEVTGNKDSDIKRLVELKLCCKVKQIISIKES